MPFRTYIIGDDSLLPKCGQVLLDHKHAVMGIVTSDPRAEEWAARNGIKIFTALKDLESYIASSEEHVPDYIFSISNIRLLHTSTLSLARKFCINYHNALLPQYKGANATLWAILEGQRVHGISWHVMTEGVDDGDLLLQVEIPIDSGENAASLNIKCHRAALESFPALVDGLEAGSVHRRVQEPLDRYYGLDMRPPSFGFVVWDSAAEDIDQQCRALTTAPYLNRLTTPKILIGDIPFILVQHQILAEKSAALPGTIVAVSDGEICVATRTYNISISRLSTLQGAVYQIADFRRKHFVTVGARLSSLPKDLEVIRKRSGSNWRNENYWVQKLKEVQPCSLPFLEFDEREIGAQQVYVFGFDEALFGRVAQVFESVQQPPQMIMLVVLMTYLYRINGYNKYTLGLSDQRLREQLTGSLSKLFANTVPFSVTFDEQQSFRTILELLLRQLERDRGRFTYELDIFSRYSDIPKGVNNLPLIVRMGEVEEGLSSRSLLGRKPGVVITLGSDSMMLQGYGIHNAGVFETGIRKIFQHAETLLRVVVDNPDAPLCQLSFLSAEERDDILRACNIRPPLALPELAESSTLKSLFEMVMRGRRTGADRSSYDDAVGLISGVAGEIGMSFKEIDIKSERIARYLLSSFADSPMPISSRPVIAVCLDTPLLQVIAMLGILRSGATYLPLDSKLPPEQLLYVLQLTHASTLFTRSGLASQLYSYRGTIIRLDRELHVVYQDRERERVLAVDSVRPEDVAYIISTSGSTTGRPKSVPIQHRQIVASLEARNRYYADYMDGEAPMRMLLLMSTAFDTSVAVMFWPLLSGGKLFVLSPDQIKDAHKIVNTISQNGITHIVCVPALYDKILAAASSAADLASLKMVIVGGDYLPESLVDRHIELVPSAFLFDEFGLTEVAICSTAQVVFNPRTRVRQQPTSGYAIGRNKLFIVDQHDQLVPFGVVGKLLLGGDQLSSEYLGEEAASRRFRTIHFGEENVPVFDTGDLVSFTPEHGMLHRGREDFQLKISGTLVMPSQIEKWLSEYPNVKSCAVAGKRNTVGDIDLVAYIVPENSREPVDYGELKQYLRRYLPPVAIPTVFMLLDQLPLTLHSKIDRKALPVPGKKHRQLLTASVEATTPIERPLVAIWRELLQLDEVGVEDNFFELGGRSLHVTELLTRVQRFFDARIEVVQFYQHPTVRALGTMIERGHVVHEGLSPLFVSDLSAELDIKLEGLERPDLGNLQHILVTGVTGFLGVNLLNELLTRTRVHVYCLVRADDLRTAQEKLTNTIARCRLDSILPRLESQVTVILGDLSQPRFGLSEGEYMGLAGRIDAVCHNAAYVHHFLSYTALRSANVLGVLEVIRFASTRRLKPIQYISTLSATTTRDAEGRISEDFQRAEVDPGVVAPKNGYTQTKWVAEVLLSRAQQKGMLVSIFRPSWLLGHSDTGACLYEQNHLLLLLKGCIQMEKAPIWSTRLNIMPVDYVSRVIVRALFNPEAHGRVYNLHNPYEINWTDFIAMINRARLARVELIDAIVWRDDHLSRVTQGDCLYPLSPFYLRRGEEESAQELPSLDPNIRFENTRAIIEQLGMEYPHVTRELLMIYFSFLRAEGFMGSPADLHDEAVDLRVDAMLASGLTLFSAKRMISGGAEGAVQVVAARTERPSMRV